MHDPMYLLDDTAWSNIHTALEKQLTQHCMQHYMCMMSLSS